MIRLMLFKAGELYNPGPIPIYIADSVEYTACGLLLRNGRTTRSNPNDPAVDLLLPPPRTGEVYEVKTVGGRT